jgi:hypothetical protein
MVLMVLRDQLVLPVQSDHVRQLRQPVPLLLALVLQPVLVFLVILEVLGVPEVLPVLAGLPVHDDPWA